MRNGLPVILLLLTSVLCRGYQLDVGTKNTEIRGVNCKVCSKNWNCPAGHCPNDGKRNGQELFAPAEETKRDFDNSLSQQKKMIALLKRLMEDYY